MVAIKQLPFKLLSEELDTEVLPGREGKVRPEVLQVAGEGEVVSLQQLGSVLLPHPPAAGGEQEQLQVQQGRAEAGPSPGGEHQLLPAVHDVVHAHAAVEEGYEVTGGL